MCTDHLYCGAHSPVVFDNPPRPRQVVLMHVPGMSILESSGSFHIFSAKFRRGNLSMVGRGGGSCLCLVTERLAAAPARVDGSGLRWRRAWGCARQDPPHRGSVCLAYWRHWLD